jgi:hypothetical protein
MRSPGTNHRMSAWMSKDSRKAIRIRRSSYQRVSIQLRSLVKAAVVISEVSVASLGNRNNGESHEIHEWQLVIFPL